VEGPSSFTSLREGPFDTTLDTLALPATCFVGPAVPVDTVLGRGAAAFFSAGAAGAIDARRTGAEADDAVVEDVVGGAAAGLVGAEPVADGAAGLVDLTTDAVAFVTSALEAVVGATGPIGLSDYRRRVLNQAKKTHLGL
jgi:hypothetical protein